MINKDYATKKIDDRFRLIRLLGQGSLGSVHLGKHVALGRLVTIEFIHSDLLKDDGAVMSFYREALMAARIAHDNAVEVIDMGLSFDEEPYLVVENTKGETLAALIGRNGPLDLGAACGILEPALHVLAAAHAKGIVHLDLTPEHILIVRQLGDKPVVKIGYLDPRKLRRGANEPLAVLTESLDPFGPYTSPEQLRGETEVDHRADLYALGVILYEMLTGKLPFEGNDKEALLSAMENAGPRPPSEANANFPAEAQALVMGLLSPQPDGRPRDATAVLESVKQLTGFDERENRLSRFCAGLKKERFVAGYLSEMLRDQGAREVLSPDVLLKGHEDEEEFDEIQATDTDEAVEEDESVRESDAAALQQPDGSEAEARSAQEDEPAPAGAEDPPAEPEPQAQSEQEDAPSPAGTEDRPAEPESQAQGDDEEEAKRPDDADAEQDAEQPYRISAEEESDALFGAPLWKARHKQMVIGAAAVGVIVLMLLVGMFVSDSDEEAQAADEPVVTFPKVLEPKKTPDTVAPEKQTVQVQVAGAPDGAKIYYRDTLMADNPFQVEKGASAALVKIEADGYKPYEESVTPSEDRKIYAIMDPVAKSERAPVEDRKTPEKTDKAPALKKEKKAVSAAALGSKSSKKRAKTPRKPPEDKPVKKSAGKTPRKVKIAEDFE